MKGQNLTLKGPRRSSGAFLAPKNRQEREDSIPRPLILTFCSVSSSPFFGWLPPWWSSLVPGGEFAGLNFAIGPIDSTDQSLKSNFFPQKLDAYNRPNLI